jgi:hypothetical protein
MITVENAELAQSYSAQENCPRRDEGVMVVCQPVRVATSPAAAQRTRAHLVVVLSPLASPPQHFGRKL